VLLTFYATIRGGVHNGEKTWVVSGTRVYCTHLLCRDKERKHVIRLIELQPGLQLGCLYRVLLPVF